MQTNTVRYDYKAINDISAHPGTYSANKSDNLQGLSASDNIEQVAVQGASNESKQCDRVILSSDSRTQNANGVNISTSKPQDGSSKLTKRLVAALGQFEVRQVISSANKNLMSLRMIAAAGNGEDAKLARSYIKKLEKLINRASSKLEDLNKEDILKFQQARAKQQKQKQRVEEIKAELRKKQHARMARENGYLLGDLQENILGTKDTANAPMPVSGVTSEAAIAAQAETIAAAEMAAGNIGSADGNVSLDISISSTASADAGSADVSLEGGGDVVV